MLSSKPTQSPPSPSAHAIANTDYLLTEILIRLPVKSLLRFKSVSKHWLSLISTPYFSRRHSNRLPTSASGLFLQGWYDQYSYLFDFNTNNLIRGPPSMNDEWGLKILSSCNGLLCCCTFRVDRPIFGFYVCNPSTKQFTIIPNFIHGEDITFRSALAVGFAFDPSKSPHYKVICLRRSFKVPSSKNLYHVEIYSSEEGGPWRVYGDPFTFEHDRMDFEGGVYWNGVVHWICLCGVSLCFDVDKECIRDMPMPMIPDGGGEKRQVLYFGESRGHLHLIENYAAPITTHFDVNEMDRDYSGWFVKYRVDLEPILVDFPLITTRFDFGGSNCYAFQILGLVRGENEEESFLVLSVPNYAIRYDLEEKTVKKLYDLSGLRASVGVCVKGATLKKFHAHQYIESLSCV